MSWAQPHELSVTFTSEEATEAIEMNTSSSCLTWGAPRTRTFSALFGDEEAPSDY